MTKKRILPSLFILTFTSLVAFASTARSETESVVFGSDNVQVHSSAETRVNDKSVRVESDQPGSIEVEMTDDQVEIKTNGDVTPTIFVSDEEIEPTIVQLPRNFFVSVRSFLERISNWLLTKMFFI